MEKENDCSGGGGGGRPARRFSFSWADEVEREEKEQDEEEVRDEQPTRLRAKPDPFGAARPREVVLAEKGVDWRALDGKLHGPHRAIGGVARASPRTRAQAQGKRSAPAATAPSPAQTPRRQRADAATPMRRHRGPKVNAPPVSYSGAWGGKRKCARDASARQVRPAADPGRRRVFGELNVGEGGGASCWSSRKSSDSAGAEGIGSFGTRRNAAAADGENGDSTAPMMAGAKAGGPGVGRRRRGKGRRQKMAMKQ